MVTRVAERPIAPGLEQPWPLLLIAETGVSRKRLGNRYRKRLSSDDPMQIRWRVSAGSCAPTGDRRKPSRCRSRRFGSIRCPIVSRVNRSCLLSGWSVRTGDRDPQIGNPTHPGLYRLLSVSGCELRRVWLVGVSEGVCGPCARDQSQLYVDGLQRLPATQSAGES